MAQTTLRAFKQMMATPDIHDQLEISRSEVLEIRKKINEHALGNPEKWGITQ